MNKKFILGLGALTAVAAPVAAVISCNGNNDTGKSSLDADLAKFKNTTSTLEKHVFSEKTITDEITGDAVTEAQLTEAGFTVPTLSEGVSATFKIKSAYDSTTGAIGITVTLKKGSDAKSKDFTITAKANSGVTPKYTKVTTGLTHASSDTGTVVVSAVLTGDKYADVTPFAPLTKNLPYGIYSSSAYGAVSILKSLGETAGYTNAQLKLVAAALKSVLTNKEIASKLDDNGEAVFNEFAALKAADRKAENIAKELTDGLYGVKQKDDKYIKVEFANNKFASSLYERDAIANLETELAKFNNDATSTKTKAELKTALESKNAGDAVSKEVLGYAEPTLSAGVTATYKIAVKYADGKVVVTVILAKTGFTPENTVHNTKYITITPKADA